MSLSIRKIKLSIELDYNCNCYHRTSNDQVKDGSLNSNFDSSIFSSISFMSLKTISSYSEIRDE
jgi:hypothetical protein